MDDRQRACVLACSEGCRASVTELDAREETGLGLMGWVRNERDGSVTAWFTGVDAAVSVMAERLWQGPTGTGVSRIDLEELDTWIAPGDFRIIV